MMNQRGFTFIEIIIVLAIGIVIAALLLGGLARQNDLQDLDLATTALVSLLRDAQERARGQEAGVSWGVYFDNPNPGRDLYSLFSGSTYSTATSTTFLPPSVEFSDPASGTNKEVVFQKVTGLPSSATSVTLRLVDDTSETQVITLNANGSISF